MMVKPYHPLLELYRFIIIAEEWYWLTPTTSLNLVQPFVWSADVLVYTRIPLGSKSKFHIFITGLAVEIYFLLPLICQLYLIFLVAWNSLAPLWSPQWFNFQLDHPLLAICLSSLLRLRLMVWLSRCLNTFWITFAILVAPTTFQIVLLADLLSMKWSRTWPTVFCSFLQVIASGLASFPTSVVPMLGKFLILACSNSLLSLETQKYFSQYFYLD